MSVKSPREVDVLVGQNIRFCRMQRKLSQTELGHRIGVTFQQIQKYEKGTNRIGASRVVQIAEALDVSLTILFDGSSSTDRVRPDQTVRALLAKPHSLRLAQAFNNVPEESKRGTILQLIEAIGHARSRASSSRKGRGSGR